MADTELIELIRKASPDYPVWSVEIINAMKANPDVVLRALGGRTLMEEHGGITFQRLIGGTPEVPEAHSVWLIPEPSTTVAS